MRQVKFFSAHQQPVSETENRINSFIKNNKYDLISVTPVTMYEELYLAVIYEKANNSGWDCK